MLNQLALLDAARVAIARREDRAAPVTYYRVSKELGLTSAYMTQLTRCTSIMSAEIAHKLAALAEIDPAYAMACIEAERASRDELETSGTWRKIADALAGKAAAVLACVILSFFSLHSTPVQASTYARACDEVGTGGLYIMRSRIRRRWRALLRSILPGLLAPCRAPC